MFTGLVEGQGTVRRVTALPVGVRLAIVPDPGCFDSSEVQQGDSIAISGCCLTVIACRDGELEFEAGEETLSKTTLRRLCVGSRVNLERSLRAGARLGGHFVQGHIDTTAIVSEVRKSGDWTDLWFTMSADHLRLLVPKGSVAVDGVSLTVVNVDAGRFSVALIPHTLQVTTLGQRITGDLVNVETDILGKYIDRLLEARLSGSHGGRTG